MREILFRGKAINRERREYRTLYKNGDWVYGLVTKLYDERFKELPAEMTNEYGISGIEIDHNTLGQYTGICDKNGTKIFEGDIILNKYVLTHSEAKQTKEQRIGVIIYDKCEFRADKYVNGKIDGAFWIKHIWKGDSIEVIGNIHDNPESLKDGEEK